MAEASNKEHLLMVSPVPLGPPVMGMFAKRFPDMKVDVYVPEGRSPIPPEKYKDATIVATYGDYIPKPSDAPHLELLHLFSAGSDQMKDHAVYTESEIPITCTSGVHGPQISELVFMTALTLNHGFGEHYDNQKKKLWPDRHFSEQPFRTRDLCGQRLGILGYGSIGRQVARVGKAMGMDVIAYTHSAKDTPEKRKDQGYWVPGTGDPDGSFPSAWYHGADKASLHEFLKQDIDFLVISVPLTNDTNALLGAEEFDILSRKQALISNIARGSVIDQPALADALKAGKLRGACLDVTEPEPLPADDPLWDAPNLVVTPHVAGNSTNYIRRAFELFMAIVERKMKGERMYNVVDRKRGY
ncbi:hypothetical protein NA57DRAFT_55427 [Rhizodiscina lignyota]|uniref:D-isomer specific 2-hydroxyacid dehydrogenase NAD-binding domain-containing protein n=1 Tax=Rhizodiscina lignyota TaxID=1504668 RepID=A0A9P4MB76_9PEZI|nr:hypothetical protein NA57DRAFT_55427 [Rhizodiscina lignyota]